MKSDGPVEQLVANPVEAVVLAQTGGVEYLIVGDTHYAQLKARD